MYRCSKCAKLTRGLRLADQCVPSCAELFQTDDVCAHAQMLWLNICMTCVRLWPTVRVVSSDAGPGARVSPDRSHRPHVCHALPQAIQLLKSKCVQRIFPDVCGCPAWTPSDCKGSSARLSGEALALWQTLPPLRGDTHCATAPR
jgi:hypothetical protein